MEIPENFAELLSNPERLRSVFELLAALEKMEVVIGGSRYPLHALPGPATVKLEIALADTIGNLGVSRLNGGQGASASTFWRGDGTWAGGGGALSLARVYRTANQSIPTGITTAMQWQAASYDTAAYFNAGTPTRLTCAVAGVYQIRASCAFAVNATGSRHIYIYRNGVPEIASNGRPASAAGAQTVDCVTDFYCAAGDYLEVFVWQDSGGNLNVFGSGTPGDDRTNFSITRMS